LGYCSAPLHTIPTMLLPDVDGDFGGLAVGEFDRERGLARVLAVDIEVPAALCDGSDIFICRAHRLDENLGPEHILAAGRKLYTFRQRGHAMPPGICHLDGYLLVDLIA